MNEQTKSLIEGQLASYRLLEPIKISDTVHSWLNMLNRVVDVCNIVGYPEEDETIRTYSNLFGFMTSVDKLYLDGIKNGIFPEEPVESISVEVSVASANPNEDKTALFNSLIREEKYSTLSYENLENGRKRIRGRSDLVRTFVRALGIELNWNEISDSSETDIHWTPFVDVDARNVNVTNHATKKARVIAVNRSIAGNSGTITVNVDSKDIQCINAKSDVTLQFIASTDDSFYCEKLISIKAEEEVRVFYTSNTTGGGYEWKFVNNSIYPNVEWSNEGVATGSLLLKNTFIVYKATFIHSRILLEVVENSQLVDNYKAASAKHDNLSFNGSLVYDADSRALKTLTEMVNGDLENRTVYVYSSGVISSVADLARCVSSFELNCTTGENAKWTSVSLRCRPVSSEAFLESNVMELQDGRHLAQLWTVDRSMVVKVDYAVSKDLRTISILGFSVISMNSGRTYDE